MKILKVYDEVHKAVKVEAARSGKTASNFASELIRHALAATKAGSLKMTEEPTPTGGKR